MIDILTDETGDLLIKNGDFVLGECTEQNQHFLLFFQPGELKEFPNVGVGLVNYLNDSDPDEMLSEIRKQFKADGMTINSLDFDETLMKLNYNATY